MKQGRKIGRIAGTVGTFAAGATLGSVLGLLFAPASGKVLRKRIGMKVRTFEHTAQRNIKQAKKLLARKADNLREAAAEKLGQSREWITERLASNNNKHPSRRLAHHA